MGRFFRTSMPGETVPIAGSIVGLVVASDSARIAGTATFTVRKNGVATSLVTTLDATNTTMNRVLISEGIEPIAAGDELTVWAATDLTWAPNNADITCTIYVQFD